MNKKIAILTAIAAFAAAAGIVVWLIMRGAARVNPAAEIYLNGELLKTVPLSEECEFVVDCGEGHNTVKVHNGAVSVTEADCPDKVCVRTGAVSGGTVPIVCLPHRLEIRVVNGADGIDAAAVVFLPTAA
ncbi:MAG: NusG domain II-containing protein [Lachnospiraceae bacterium]|nr:NusG domain II-containing protein [Ruminococcus sp.]MCM1274302.1 NusG domain II-containing protein [Lachnospiraceae bacterium]